MLRKMAKQATLAPARAEIEAGVVAKADQKRLFVYKKVKNSSKVSFLFNCSMLNIKCEAKIVLV